MRASTVRVIAWPAVEPVSLADAKAQLGMMADHNDFDAFLVDKLAAARELAEARLGQSLALKQYRATYTDPNVTDLVLPNPPLVVDEDHEISVTVDGVALDAEEYTVNADFRPAVLELDETPSGDVVVEYWAGPTPGEPFSRMLKSAILLYVTHQFENRGVLAANGSAELPQAFETLLAAASHNGGY